MDERVRFISDFKSGLWSVAELSRRYGVSRKTEHKWMRRYEDEGVEGLAERSRRPESCAHETPVEVVQAILECRRLHPSWGAKKLLALLARKRPDVELPGRTTVCNVLERHGMIAKRRRRRNQGHPGRPTPSMTSPNETWTADFKGQFRTGDGELCHPLTVADGFSRFVLDCRGLDGTTHDGARRTFRGLFREYGLPEAILTDNGVPFASNALRRLSRLSVWWIRLGIAPVLIEPSHPEQNGRHERMHRTLKAETARPPAGSRSAQQRRFNRFLEEFNFDRPHEALGQATPASLYEPSPRPYPEKLPEIEYPAYFEARLVSGNGGIRWNGEWVNVSHVLEGTYVGLEEIDARIWDVHFGPLRLGRLDERTMRIEDELGKKTRRKV